jgi:hypothetical protein
MIRPFIISILAVALTALGAEAQRRTELPPGARIRVSAPVFHNGVEVPGARRPETGTLVSVDSVSLTARMERSGDLLTVPFDAVRRLDVSRGVIPAREGRPRGLRKGALVGAGFTAGVYGLMYLFQTVVEGATETECDAETTTPCSLFPDEGPELPFMVPVIAGGTIGGALLGASLGSRDRERWQGVRPRSLAPTEGSVSVSVRF